MNGLLNSQMMVASRPLTRETAQKLLEKYGLLLEPGRLKYSGIYNIFADDNETGERKEVGVISEYELSLHTEMKGIKTTWTFLFENPGAPASAVQYENTLDQLLAIMTEEQ